MPWIFVLCGCLFLLSLSATSQVWTVSLKAGLYTYKAVEPTPNSLRSVRRESDMSECGNTIGYTGTR